MMGVMPEPRHNHAEQGRLPVVALAALGVVYGDIGTSPLYALRECFSGPHAMDISSGNVLGILSTIFWALTITITVKYLAWVMRADNRGEGGVLALMALATPVNRRGQNRLNGILLAFGIFGAALMYGDSIITPAISVLSAVEGLKIATHVFEPYILPITLLILFGLFYVQKRGTAQIGKVFGPITLVWFIALGMLGIRGILMKPDVLAAINPMYAFNFFVTQGKVGFLALGSVFLVVTGGEALFADMGHFGRKPIRAAWFTVAMPCLLLNYFGQGALLIVDTTSAENPFYLLAPSWALYPLVGLATLAAFIASQAVITSAFSLTRQAILLGYSPRMQIDHTSSSEIGQIYMPHVNWMIFFATAWLVLTFKSSSSLAAAYGIAVSSCMVITTILAAVVARRRWGWPVPVVLLVALSFGAVDLTFFAANAAKIAHGGWFPISVAIGIFTLMTTWRRGRRILAHRLRMRTKPLDGFLAETMEKKPVRVSGTAVFMTSDPEGTPPALFHNFKHNKVLHKRIVLLTIMTAEIPHVPNAERVTIEEIAPDFHRVKAQYGFMETPNMHNIFGCCVRHGLILDMDDMTFFLGRETLLATNKPGMAVWREKLFSIMSRNAQRATTFFSIPPERVIELGVEVEM